MIIKTKLIEKAFNKKVIPFISCLGIDTASRTGWCIISTNPKEIVLHYGFLDIKTTDLYYKYNKIIEYFSTNMIKTDEKIIIEKAFYGRNVKGFQILSQIGMIIYTIAHLKGNNNKEFMLATQARKNLGLPAIRKKEEVHKAFKNKTKIKLKDPDIIDALILALNGVLIDK